MQNNKVVKRHLIELPVCVGLSALADGSSGITGKYVCSFFNPAMSAAGTFGSFAAIGALSGLLGYCTFYLLENSTIKSDYLDNYPNFKQFLKVTADHLIGLTTVSVAAAMLGYPPFGAAVLSLMVIPAATYLFQSLYYAVKGILAMRTATTHPQRTTEDNKVTPLPIDDSKATAPVTPVVVGTVAVEVDVPAAYSPA